MNTFKLYNIQIRIHSIIALLTSVRKGKRLQQTTSNRFNYLKRTLQQNRGQMQLMFACYKFVDRNESGIHPEWNKMTQNIVYGFDFVLWVMRIANACVQCWETSNRLILNRQTQTSPNTHYTIHMQIVAWKIALKLHVVFTYACISSEVCFRLKIPSISLVECKQSYTTESTVVRYYVRHGLRIKLYIRHGCYCLNTSIQK